MERVFLTSLLLLTTAACTPEVRTTLLGVPRNTEARSDERIELYSASVPQCPFDEIGVVSVLTAPAIRFSRGDAVTALQRKAWQIGGDALIGFAEYHEPTTAGARTGYRGTAIRFRDESCTH